MKTWRPYEKIDSSGYVWRACAIYAIAHATGMPMSRHIIDKVIRNAELRGSRLSEDSSWEEDILITHHQ